MDSPTQILWIVSPSCCHMKSLVLVESSVYDQNFSRVGARVWLRLNNEWFRDLTQTSTASFHGQTTFRALSSSCHLVLVEKHISLTFHAHICISSHDARKNWGNFQRWNKDLPVMNKMPLMLPRSVVQFLSEPLICLQKGFSLVLCRRKPHNKNYFMCL